MMKEKILAYKTKVFDKWMKKEGLSDSLLIHTVKEMNNGLVGAKLAKLVYKKRIAMPGKGKRGSSRAIIAFKLNDKVFFMYGYSKNQRDNITGRELIALKKLSSELMSYSSQTLSKAVRAGEIIEVKSYE